MPAPRPAAIIGGNRTPFARSNGPGPEPCGPRTLPDSGSERPVPQVGGVGAVVRRLDSGRAGPRAPGEGRRRPGRQVRPCVRFLVQRPAATDLSSPARVPPVAGVDGTTVVPLRTARLRARHQLHRPAPPDPGVRRGRWHRSSPSCPTRSPTSSPSAGPCCCRARWTSAPTRSMGSVDSRSDQVPIRTSPTSTDVFAR